MPLAGRGLTLLTAALLAAGIVAAYSNSLDVGFEFDDVYVIRDNPAIRSLRNIPRFFYDPFTLTTVRENVDLRPVLQLTYALNYAISGLQPWSYHVLNMALHLIAALLVFRIVRDHLWRGPGAGVPVAAALFFALAPLNSQTLDYMSARSALLCTTLYLAAFWCVLDRRQWLGALLHAAALLTKAVAITLPAVLVAHDFLYRDRVRQPTLISYLRGWRRVLRLVLLPVVLDLAFLLYRRLLLPPWVSTTFHERFATPWIWFMSEWSGQLYYVRLFFWPDALSIDYAFPYTFGLSQPRAWLALLAIVAWVAVALRGAARRPMVAFATVWFFITLAPESSFAPLAEVINDHRPYIASSLGLSVLLAWVVHEVSSRLRQFRQQAFALACVALCAAAIPVIRHRNWQWQDSVRLWTDAVEKNPANGRAWMNGGVSLMGRGQLVEARRYLERARDLSPGYAYAYMNLSVLETHEGHLDAALRAAEEAIRIEPGLAPAHYFHGQVLAQLGRGEEAAAAYRRTLAIDPRQERASVALARLTPDGASGVKALMQAGLDALYQAHDAERAARDFRLVLDSLPTHYGATYQLAVALDAANRPQEARPFWEKTLAMAEGYDDQPTVATARQRLAQPGGSETESLMQAGLDALYARRQPDEATAAFRKVLERNPTHYGATYQLARALDLGGHADEARRLWATVLEMADGYGDRTTAAAARERLLARP